jgi:NAD(P)-dependent dehydrogenase (short-subunit alcohol dehydrogenase family)
MRLQNKVAIITGAGQALQRKAAKSLPSSGMHKRQLS